MGSLLFCRKSRQEKLNEQENAIFECKVCRDKIKNYITRLSRNENLQREKAKAYLKEKNKERAKLALNQSKFYRAQITVANGQLNLIEEQVNRIEMALNQKEALEILQKGNEVLKNLQSEVNVEKWEKIADDMDELREKQNEIGEFLKNHNLSATEFDEEVNKELEKLMKVESIVIEDELPNAKQEEFPSVSKKDEVVNNIHKNQEEVKEKQEIALEN